MKAHRRLTSLWKQLCFVLPVCSPSSPHASVKEQWKTCQRCPDTQSADCKRNNGATVRAEFQLSLDWNIHIPAAQLDVETRTIHLFLTNQGREIQADVNNPSVFLLMLFGITYSCRSFHMMFCCCYYYSVWVGNLQDLSGSASSLTSPRTAHRACLDKRIHRPAADSAPQRSKLPLF